MMILLYLVAVHCNVMFWEHIHLFAKSMMQALCISARYYLSALYKKQGWAQVILVDHYFTFSLSETASLERRRNRTVSNSGVCYFCLCIDSIGFCQLAIEKHMAL